MRKTNPLKSAKKPAQHVVEFSLIMPFFVILFCYTFQIMAETYAKYKFTYIFSNAVRTSIQYQPVYFSKETASSYDFQAIVENILNSSLTGGSSSPYTSIGTGRINTNKTVFMAGMFQYNSQMPFISKTNGGGYFYFILPLNSAWVEPLVLDITESDIESFFSSAQKHYEGESESEGAFGVLEAE